MGRRRELATPPAPIDSGSSWRDDASAPELHRPRRLRWLVIVALAVVVALAAVAVSVRDVHSAAPFALQWWVVAAMFLFAELTLLHVQLAREQHVVSLSEVPLVLGLFFASPLGLVVGRVLGTVVVAVARRRQTPTTAAFHVAVQAAAAAVPLAVLHLLAPASLPQTPATWLVVYAAVWCAAAVEGTAAVVVAEAEDDTRRSRTVLRELFVYPSVSLVVATLAIAAPLALYANGRGALFLALLAVVSVTGYRAYARLADRHRGLERLYRFGRRIAATPDVDTVLEAVVREARELLHGRVAEVALVTHADRHLVLAVDRSGRLHHPDGPALLPEEMDLAEAVGVVLRSGHPHPLADRLTVLGARELVVAPLYGDSGVVGYLAVADRDGERRRFGQQDAILLETLANHAAMAIENCRLINRLQHHAMHDALTGLPNRVLFKRLAEEAVAAASATASYRSQRGAAVMIVDLNGFKEINDTLGHTYGDHLLVDVAARFTAAAGEGVTVARLGGDEFAVLVPSVSGPAGAARVAAALHTSLDEPFVLDELQLDVGAAVGIALAPRHGRDVATLLKRADMAMYAAKHDGTAVCVFHRRLDSHTPARLARVTELRQAIAAHQLTVHVQPKVELTTGRVTSVEALVRWPHDADGLLAPAEFVPIAERVGLIREMTRSVLDEVIRAFAAWQRDGLVLDGVAVNLSARSLHTADVVADVRTLLDKHDVEPSALTLEITEDSVIHDPDLAIRVLEGLRDMGVRLSVDDFGTGYSSLAYLRRLPVHEVKIDKSFVLGMTRSEADAAIVRSIVDLGANLHLSVVAEGVEDARTWRQLRAVGCDLAQGYYLGRPMPIETFPAWLRSHPHGLPRRTAGASGVA